MATFRIKTRVCTVLRWSYTRRFATTIFSATTALQYCCDIVSMCCTKSRRCESSHVTSPLFYLKEGQTERKLLGVFSEFFFLFLKFRIWLLGIQFHAGIIAMKIKKSRIHFFSGRFRRLWRCTHSSDLEFMKGWREKFLLATSWQDNVASANKSNLKTKAVRQNVLSANKNKDTMFSIQIMCFDKICPRQSERQQPLYSISHRVWMGVSLLPSSTSSLLFFTKEKWLLSVLIFFFYSNLPSYITMERNDL